MNRSWKLLLCAAVLLALAAPVMAGNGAVRGGPLTLVPKPEQPAPLVYNSMRAPAGHVLALQWAPGIEALNAAGPNTLFLFLSNFISVAILSNSLLSSLT